MVKPTQKLLIDDDPEYLEKAVKYTKAIQDSDQEALESITRKILLEGLNEEAEKKGEKL